MKPQVPSSSSDSAPKLELPSKSEAEAESPSNTHGTSAHAITTTRTTTTTPTPKPEQKLEHGPSKANGERERERERHLVIVNLQETAFDAQCSVRLFARIETVLALLLAALLPSAPPPAPASVDASAVGTIGEVDANVPVPSASANASVADGRESDNGRAADWYSALRLDEAALARLARGHEPTQCAVCAGEETALAARHLPATVTRLFK